MTSRTVGVIGLGVMGLPMATRLLDHGFPVLAYNRSARSLNEIEALGAQTTKSIGELAAKSDAVLTVLPDTPDVESVLDGPSGVISSARPGTLLIDCSTIRPQVSRRLATIARSRGLRPLDAPVSGGEVGAKAGTLSVMVGGTEDDVAAARPIFEALAKTVIHVGEDGAGQVVKAANQLVVAGNLAMISEAIVLLESAGVEPLKALAVLQGGLAASRCLELKAATMVARSFPPGFRVDLHRKDLAITQAIATACGATLPVTDVVVGLMEALHQLGAGQQDHSALLLAVEAKQQK